MPMIHVTEIATLLAAAADCKSTRVARYTALYCVYRLTEQNAVYEYNTETFRL